MAPVNVTGLYADAADGIPSGFVAFHPQLSVVHANPLRIVNMGRVLAPLDAAGKIDVDLIASDDPEWRATGPVPYVIREQISGLDRTWLAYVYGPGPVDIADLVPLTESPDVGVVPVPGPAGPPGEDGATGPEGPQGVPGVATGQSRRYLWSAVLTGDPGSGRVMVENIGGQTREIRISKYDSAGVYANLAVLLPGDAFAIMDTPEEPPTTGYARYEITAPIIDQGTYWELIATRTTTSGTTIAPPAGTAVQVVATMGSAEAYFPQYEFVKVGYIGSIGTVFQAVATLDAGDLPAGTYEVGFSVSWIGTDVGSTLVLRTQPNSDPWSVYAKDNASADYWQSFFVQYPQVWAGGPLVVKMEAKRDGAGAIDLAYTDMWVRRVK